MPYVPILTYHRLLRDVPTRTNDPKRIAVGQAQFHSHLRLLKLCGYRTISLADYPTMLRQNTVPRGPVFAITFDDGYEEVLTLALPILRRFGFTATVFAVPGELGGANRWDDGRARLLSLDQYKILQNAGITIGGHSLSHPHLTRVLPDIARQEILESRKRLQMLLDKPVTLFAYPYGESNTRIEAFVQEAGYFAGFATDRAPRDHILNPYRLRRVVVFPKTNALQLLWKVQQFYPAYQDFRRKDKESNPA
jgi:peptidoglycan/xylan/chitin deacetylase (PgdA/CDA1 family)